MKKIIILMFILISILGVFSQSFAVLEVGQRNVYPKADCEKLMTYNGTPIRTTYTVYNKDGVEYPAYCLDVNLSGVENGEYVVSAMEKLQNQDVWRAIINGYPYKSLEELGAANGQEAFTATKQAVYTMLYNRDISSYGAVDSDSGRRTYQIYCNIVNAARNSTETIQNNIQIFLNSLNDEWKFEKGGFLSKEYMATANISSGNYTIALSGEIPEGTRITDLVNNDKNTFALGEHFKIIMPIQSSIKDGNFSINADAKLNTKPVMLGKTTVPGTQDYALTGFMYEEFGANFKENYLKNLTKIVIYKMKDDIETPLEGVKFELYNDNEEVINSDLITDENGRIEIDNLLPGKYYLKEVETLNGYELLEDIVEIELELNEEKEIVITNREIPKPEPVPTPTPILEQKVLPRTGN